MQQELEHQRQIMELMQQMQQQTRSRVSLMVGSWNEEASNCNAGSEKCTVWKSEMARQSSPNLGTMRPEAILKVEGRAKPTNNVFVADALATLVPIAKPRPTLMEDY